MITEQELRVLVRQAIARHAGDSRTIPSSDLAPSHRHAASSHPAPSHSAAHSSHALFVVPSGADADGPCIIEPAVMCNHCGYCKSLGH